MQVRLDADVAELVTDAAAAADVSAAKFVNRVLRNLSAMTGTFDHADAVMARENDTPTVPVASVNPHRATVIVAQRRPIDRLKTRR